MITAKFRVYCDDCQHAGDTFCIVKVNEDKSLSLMYPGELGTAGMAYDEKTRDVWCIDDEACDMRRKLWIERSHKENREWQKKLK